MRTYQTLPDYLAETVNYSPPENPEYLSVTDALTSRTDVALQQPKELNGKETIILGMLASNPNKQLVRFFSFGGRFNPLSSGGSPTGSHILKSAAAGHNIPDVRTWKDLFGRPVTEVQIQAEVIKIRHHHLIELRLPVA